MLTVTSGLETFMEYMITKNYLFMLYIILVYIDHVFCFGIKTTCYYSYAKIMTTKSWMLLNMCLALSLMNPMLHFLSTTRT